MKHGLIDVRFLFASSPLVRLAAASVEFVPMLVSSNPLFNGSVTLSKTLSRECRRNGDRSRKADPRSPRDEAGVFPRQATPSPRGKGDERSIERHAALLEQQVPREGRREALRNRSRAGPSTRH